jgi:hypothetical protein
MNVTFNIVQNTKSILTYLLLQTRNGYVSSSSVNFRKIIHTGRRCFNPKIRATLYINSDDAAPPTINIPTEDGTILTLIYSYDFSGNRSCDVWYVKTTVQKLWVI